MSGLPDGFKVRLLGDVAHVTTGGKNNQDKVPNGRYPFFVRSATVERIDSYTFDGEAILVPGEGGIGSIFHYVNGKFDTHQRVYRISDFSPEVLGRYVYYYMRHCFGAHAMQNTAKATVDSLRRPTFMRFPLVVPASLAEQRAVVEALDDTEGLVGSLQQVIRKKQDIRTGLAQQPLTGRMRLPGFGGDWPLLRLGDHVTYVRTVSLSRAQLDEDSPVRYLHYGDIHTRDSVTLPAGEELMPRAPGDLIGNAGMLEEGDLVFADASEDPDGVGKSVEITSVPPEGVIAGSHTIAARFDKNVLADGFKGYLQFIPAFRDALLRLAAGTKVLATTRAYISSVELALPSVEEQRTIAEVLGDADAEIEALQRRLEKTLQIREGMMQELLTGRTRLPVAEVAA